MNASESPPATFRRVVLLVGFAAVMFGCGHLWSLRQVREARHAAGLAEQERLALQQELTACRNALLLQGNPPGAGAR